MICETINQAMIIRGVKATKLAEHVSITKSTMSLFLNGKRKLGQEKLEAIFEYLGIELVIKTSPPTGR